MSTNGRRASAIADAIDEDVISAAQASYNQGRVVHRLDESRSWRRALETGFRAVLRRLGFQRGVLPEPHVRELLDVFERQRDIHLRGVLATKLLSQDEVDAIRSSLRSAEEAAIRNMLQVHDGWRDLRTLRALPKLLRVGVGNGSRR